MLAVLTLRPLLASFPTAALGAVVVYAALRLVDVAEFRRLAGFRRTELLIALATTVAVLVVGVLPGVLVAIGLSVLDLLRPRRTAARRRRGLRARTSPGCTTSTTTRSATVVPGLMVYRYDSPLFFANAEDFRSRALAAVATARRRRCAWFVLNTEAIIDIDITAVDALEDAARGAVRAGHRLRAGPDEAGPADGARAAPACWSGSARTTCSPPCRRPSRPTTSGARVTGDLWWHGRQG